MSGILRGFRKALIGVGIAGCAGAATVFSLTDDYRLRAAAATALPESLSSKLFPSANAPPQPETKWDKNWDFREPEFMVKPLKGKLTDFPTNPEEENEYNERLEKARSKVSRHILLIRHGQYNQKGEGDSERYLTELGRQQAALIGQRLKDLGFSYTFLVRSTQTRAQETAEIILKSLPSDLEVRNCDFIREGAPIPPDPPSGPSWRPPAKKFFEDGARIEAAFRRYFHRADPSQEKDSFEIYVCHANVIRYFLCRALQIPPEAWLRFTLCNCSLTWIVIRPSGFVAVNAVGDIGHMPRAKMTTN